MRQQCSDMVVSIHLLRDALCKLYICLAFPVQSLPNSTAAKGSLTKKAQAMTRDHLQRHVEALCNVCAPK